MWKSVTRVVALVALGGGVLWLATFGSFEQEMRTSIGGGYPLADFELPLLNSELLQGDTTFVRSRDLRGKVLILSLWATWCTPCIRKQPSLLALQDEFGEDGLELFGVLYRDSATVALRWLEAHDRLDYRTIVATAEVGGISLNSGLPVTLLVDRSGTVTDVFGGYRPEHESQFRARVKELLSQ